MYVLNTVSWLGLELWTHQTDLPPSKSRSAAWPPEPDHVGPHHGSTHPQPCALGGKLKLLWEYRSWAEGSREDFLRNWYLIHEAKDKLGIIRQRWGRDHSGSWNSKYGKPRQKMSTEYLGPLKRVLNEVITEVDTVGPDAWEALQTKKELRLSPKETESCGSQMIRCEKITLTALCRAWIGGKQEWTQ